MKSIEIDELKSIIVKQQSEIISLTNELVNANDFGGVSAGGNKIKALEKEIEKLKGYIAGWREENGELKEALTKSKKSVKALKTENRILKAGIQSEKETSWFSRLFGC